MTKTRAESKLLRPMSQQELTQLVVEEFSGANAQRQYATMANEGFWYSERHFIDKYFVKKGAKLLDLGCGTGRTTIPLFKMGFEIVGVDLVPKMIESAKRVAQEKRLQIEYCVGDATQLSDFADETFEYVLFSNQGWTQIPSRPLRQTALGEIYRVLKPGGLYMFTTHQRVFGPKHMKLWTKQWLKHYLMRPLGFGTPELEFGDIFFTRETQEEGKTFTSTQYIHIPSQKVVREQLELAGFQILESSAKFPRYEGKTSRVNEMFYVCRK